MEDRLPACRKKAAQTKDVNVQAGSLYSKKTPKNTQQLKFDKAPKPEAFSMKRFSIVRHQTDDGVHYDLFLEKEESLDSWHLSKMPFEMPVGNIIGIKQPDHRKAYLDYEGEISGGRGCVTQIESGLYQIVNAGDNSLTVELFVKRQKKVLTIHWGMLQ